MRTIRGLDRYPADAPPSVVAQGTFDGMHLGHQVVINTAVDRARALGLDAVVLTFDPHPLTVLRPTEAPAEILPPDERLERIATLGPDRAVVIPFTGEFARVDASVFVREILAQRLAAREVVVGFNHTFGRDALGTPAFLRELAVPLGIRIHVIEPLTIRGVVVSSSAVREALRRGDVERAGALLGRPYTLRGRVCRGVGRGHGLGYPTANIAPPSPGLIGAGVYAGRAEWNDRSAVAVINVGRRPTFGESSLTVEAHLLDMRLDLYDQMLTVAFVARIRDEQRFPSAEALRARIDEDVRATRQRLAATH